MNSRIFYLIIALLVVGFLFAPVAMAQPGDAPQLTIVAEALNIREGPGVTYPVLGVLRQDFEVPISGQDLVSGWWQITLPDGREGWVTNLPVYVDISGDTSSVPEVTVLPAESVAQSTTIAPVDTGPVSTGGGTLVFQTASGGPIYAVNADGSNLRYLTTGLDPVISPDGKTVAFTRWDSPGFASLGSVWVINVDGSGERIITNVAGRPKSPTWSPDGQQIAFNMQLGGGHPDDLQVCGKGSVPPEAFDIKWVQTETGGHLCYKLPPQSFWGLQVVDVATGEVRDLPHDTHAFSPAWDPAMPWRLVYASERGLTSLDVNQGTTWPVTEDVLDHSPAFSPDGQRLAVTYLQHDHWDIHVLNADGTGRVRLTETPLMNIIEQRLQGLEPKIWNNVAATWSPDGSQIAFLSDRNGTWEIWAMNADGSNQHSLFAPGTSGGLAIEYHGVDERSISWGPQ